MFEASVLSAAVCEPSLALLAASRAGSDDRAMTTDDLGLAGFEAGPHADEPHGGGINNRLNWLRAGVLGANDGIVSTAGIVMGVAAPPPTAARSWSPASPGWRRARSAWRRRVRLRQHPEGLRARPAREGAPRAPRGPEDELAELAGLYVEKGLSEELALQVASSSPSTTRWPRTPRPSWASTRTTSPALGTPRSPRWSSFTVGALLPLLTIMLFGPALRIWVTVVSVTIALAMTGWGSARFGYGPPAAGGGSATCWAACSRCPSPTRSARRSAPRSDIALRGLVPPPEALEHLDGFLRRAPRRG